ncbi:MAG: hypothetical protein HQL25_08270 [Candidatus Omnitrophica bacterium]|nr:hypothetical protein [Candidatus Omnitrophota bacterium]
MKMNKVMLVVIGVGLCIILLLINSFVSKQMNKAIEQPSASVQILNKHKIVEEVNTQSGDLKVDDAVVEKAAASAAVKDEERTFPPKPKKVISSKPAEILIQ